MRHVEAMVDALRARAEAPAVLDAFSGREMVRCVWAFAKLHLDYEDLLVAFAERLPRDVGALGSRDIAMLLWALAVLRIPEGPLEPLLQVCVCAGLIPELAFAECWGGVSAGS